VPAFRQAQVVPTTLDCLKAVEYAIERNEHREERAALGGDAAPNSLIPVAVSSSVRARMRLLGVLLALFFAGTACGAAMNGAPVSTGELGPECGAGASGAGYRVFACMSGGAARGYPHSKELLVLRKDGSAAAYRTFRVGGLAAGNGTVVAVYGDKLVRVTSSRITPVVTPRGIASALHRRAILVMGYGHLRVDARGDTYFFASTHIHDRYGCQNRSFERLRGGRLRQLWASSSPPNDICY